MVVQKQFLTLQEVAEALQLHPATIRRGVREGRIPEARRVPGGRIIRIPASYLTEGNGMDERDGGRAG